MILVEMIRDTQGELVGLVLEIIAIIVVMWYLTRDDEGDDDE